MCKLFKHEQQETHLDTKNEKTNTLSWIFKSATKCSSLKQQICRSTLKHYSDSTSFCSYSLMLHSYQYYNLWFD